MVGGDLEFRWGPGGVSRLCEVCEVCVAGGTSVNAVYGREAVAIFMALTSRGDAILGCAGE